MVDEGVGLANSARMYDYLLGGAQNFAADREAADRALARFPHMADSARANRSFLRRMVRYCLGELGINQFLDLGSGVPTVGNVHEVAHAMNPAARIVYVDHEPVALAHARQLLHDVAGVAVLDADLRHPRVVLESPEVCGTLDLSRPVAVLMLSVLHFIPDTDQPAEIISTYLQAMPSGSALALSQVSDDQPTEAEAAPHRAVAEVFAETSSPAYLRDRAQITALFGGHELVEPGLVDATAWHPDTTTDASTPRCGYYAGLSVIP